MNVAIRLIIWLESHESSRMHDRSFPRTLFKNNYCITSLLFFLETWLHIMTRCEGFPIFRFFLNFLCPFQNAVKTAGLTVPSQWLNLGIFFCVSMIKQILMYLEMIFGKNKEQTMRQLQFKFDPFPPEPTTICLFHQRWIKTFFTQPFYQLRIIYGLVFYKIDLVHFCNNYLVVPSQKNLLLGTRKMKNKFSVQRK